MPAPTESAIRSTLTTLRSRSDLFVGGQIPELTQLALLIEAAGTGSVPSSSAVLATVATLRGYSDLLVGGSMPELAMISTMIESGIAR